MLLKKIILRNSEEFETAIKNWSTRQRIEAEVFDGKQSLFEIADTLLVIHADHNISRENKDLREAFERKGKETHQVDINGTLSAAADSFKFWLENNHPDNVLFVGSNALVESSRLMEYLTKLADRLN